jgi:hypothetical protein
VGFYAALDASAASPADDSGVMTTTDGPQLREAFRKMVRTAKGGTWSAETVRLQLQCEGEAHCTWPPRPAADGSSR